MKKIWIIILVVAVLAFVSAAYAEDDGFVVTKEMEISGVTPGPLPGLASRVEERLPNQKKAQYVMTSNEQALAKYNALAKKLASEKKETEDKLVNAIKEDAAAKKLQAESNTALSNVVTGFGNIIHSCFANSNDYNNREFEALGDQNYKNAKLLGYGGLVALAIVTTIIIIMIRRSRANVNLQPLEAGVEATNRGVETILTEMRTGFAAVQAGITELPQRTADAVKAFDPRPIDVKAAGHHAVFTQSDDATKREVYQYFEVDEGVDPSVTPDAYELPETKNRDYAHDKIRQFVREVNNGSLQKKADAGSNAAKLKLALYGYYTASTPSGKLAVNAA